MIGVGRHSSIRSRIVEAEERGRYRNAVGVNCLVLGDGFDAGR